MFAMDYKVIALHLLAQDRPIATKIATFKLLSVGADIFTLIEYIFFIG